MNDRIRELAEQAGLVKILEEHASEYGGGTFENTPYPELEKFAELIVRECCLALWTEECHSSDLAFYEVKRNATRIKEHFGIDPKEITEAMLARSITWMEQQLANKNIS